MIMFVPSVRDMDLPILNDWRLDAWALNTHWLLGLALHSPAGEQCQHWESYSSRSWVVLCSAPSVPQPVFIIMEKAPTRAFSWLKAPTSAFTFKTLLRHY